MRNIFRAVVQIEQKEGRKKKKKKARKSDPILSKKNKKFEQKLLSCILEF